MVAGNKGMSQGSFAIKDSQGEYREISLDHVVYLRYKGGRVVRAGKTETAKPVADVRVAEGSRGNRYIVTKYQGKITCTCPGATYHGYCKHTKIFDKLAKAN
ncbi:MAG: hypothetical protein N2235_05110 [Fischerella sp.]|nr:hypothetical protein [Fischerella sp.]